MINVSMTKSIKTKLLLFKKNLIGNTVKGKNTVKG